MVKVDIGLFRINLEKYTSEKTITKTITKTIKEKIVTLLRNNRTLTVKDLEVILKIKKPTIQYQLNKLRRDGILLHQGATKSGYWVVNEKQINSNLEATRKIELYQNVPLNVGQSVGHDGKESSQKVHRKFIEKEKQIISVLHSNPYITTNDIAEYLNISRRMVQKIIKKLKDEGIVKRVDGDRGGHWEIINK